LSVLLFTVYLIHHQENDSIDLEDKNARQTKLIDYTMIKDAFEDFGDI
jgi:hypothetical protein